MARTKQTKQSKSSYPQGLQLRRVVTDILPPLKTLVDQMVKDFSRLSHQLFRETEESRYISIISIFETDINCVTQAISKMSLEMVERLTQGEEVNGTFTGDLGETRINTHMQNIFNHLQSCTHSLVGVKQILSLDIGSDGEKPVDISRITWRGLVDSSRGENESAQMHAA